MDNGSDVRRLVCTDNARSGRIRTSVSVARPNCVSVNSRSEGIGADRLNEQSAVINTESASLFRSKRDCDTRLQQLMIQQRSLGDEIQYRDCLTKSLALSCKYLTEHSVMDVSDLDVLISENCIAGDDIMYIDAKGIGPMKRMRRLLSLILNRDYRTLLIFLKSLLPQNPHVVDKVLQEFEKFLLNKYGKPQKCTLCHLVSRVDISLFVDDLLSDDEDWLPFYSKVCQTEKDGQSKEFWHELVDRVISGNIYEHISEIVLKALEACGFHSDIVMMLKEDRQMKRNTFICQCSELRSFRNSNSTDIIEDSQASQGQQVLYTRRQRVNTEKNVNVAQNGHNGKGTENLRHTYEMGHDVKVLSPKIEHFDDNINNDSTGRRPSKQQLFYETKDRELQKLLNVSGDSMDSSKQLRKRSMKNKVVEKSQVLGTLNFNKDDDKTELLKLCTHVEEYTMKTLKADEFTEETGVKEVLTTANSGLTKLRTPEIQMELLKFAITRQNEKEIKRDHEWGTTANERNFSSDFSGIKTRSPVYQESRCTDCVFELLKTGLSEKESSIDCCEHQMALLKIGIPEYENYNCGVSPYQSSQIDVDTCNSVIRSLHNKIVINQEGLVNIQNVSRPRLTNQLATKRLIMNCLIVVTLFICLFRFIVLSIYNLF